MINAKYGVHTQGWWSKKGHYAHGMGCWRSILAGVERFKSLVHIEMKNGLRVLSWPDVRCSRVASLAS